MTTYLNQEPAVVIDVAAAEEASRGLTYAPVPPGGRPPGRLPNGQGGPATPTGTPVSPGLAAGLDGKTIKQGFFALAATAAVVGGAYLLYQDHQKVTLARNGADEPAKATKRRRSADDDEEDDDDGLRRRWFFPSGAVDDEAVGDRRV